MRPHRVLLAGLLLAAASLRAQTPAVPDVSGVDSFNRALAAATRSMNDSATLALWDADGISLLPMQTPIEGKPAIAAFLRQTMAAFPGAKMEQFELHCHVIAVSGDLATEWCTEHQVVHLADDKPPFDGRGTLLFVLHHDADGRWRIKTEMWNQGKA